MVIRKSKSEVTFVFKPEQNARKVYVVGSFNQWDASRGRMQKGPNGIFRKRIRLEPGVYEYRFVADGRWYTDPDSPQAVPNPFGSENSVLQLT